MRVRRLLAVSCSLVVWAGLAPALAGDLTLPDAGRVTVELISSNAAFSNTLAVSAPGVAVALTGCGLQPAEGLGGVHVVSEKLSQRGCRVELDADPATAGIQPFAAGTVFEFGFCAQTDDDAQCEYVWASDPADNSDGMDHVRTTVVSPGVFRLAWEDLPQADSDLDFDDLIAVVRIAQDSDGDGLWNDWETLGVDSNGDGVVDLDLAALGADPNRKDIFVEIDWMDCDETGGDCAADDHHDHQPKAAAIQAVVDAFADANLDNPDGSTGITLHVELSNAIPHQNTLIIPNACFLGPVGSGFDAVKNDPANFGPTNPRRFTHHYSLWTHRQTTGPSYSGCAELPGNDFQISLGDWNYSCAGGVNAGWFCETDAHCPGSTCDAEGDLDGDGTDDQDVGTIHQQAGTFMHELGHNLDLGHGGGDWTNNKPNYLSIMNYTFQTTGIPPTDPDGLGPLTARVDYSRAALGTLVESNLSEPDGIGDGTDDTFFYCPGSTTLDGTGPGTGAINWNCDGDTTDTGLSRDLNADASVQCVAPGANGVLNTAAAGDDSVIGNAIFEGANRQCDTTASGDDVQYRPVGPMTGHFDWGNLKYDFQNAADFEDGQHTPLPEQLEELTFQRFSEEIRADVAIFMESQPDPVVTGSALTYALTVSNPRPTAAEDVVVSVDLPASTVYTSCSASDGVCGGIGNQRTVDIGSLKGGGEVSITLTATVNCAVPDGEPITATATVSAQQDADLQNNSATSTATALNPPPVISALSVSKPVLWPPNHKMVDELVGYTVSDNCGPTAEALAVTSDEPEEGLGDGDTSPDWQVLDANRLLLRAERSGRSDGRTYTITVSSTDSAGGTSTAEVTVEVPKRRRP